MTSRCTVNPAFEQKLASLPVKLRNACHEGMSVGMQELEEIARRNARWQEDGTDNGKWLVTGSARQSIKGYVLGDDPNFLAFDYREPVYHTRHHSPTNAFPDHDASETTITGILTMSEDTQGGSWGSNLQKYETEGASTMAPGEPITVETMMQEHKAFLWNLIMLAVRMEL